MEDKNGQIKNTHSISAGLDYPGVGPEHSWLKDMKRVEYTAVTDKEALDAFFMLTQKRVSYRRLKPLMHLPMHLN